MKFVTLALASFLVGGCAGTVAPETRGVVKVYPITAEQADVTIATAMAQQLAKPPVPIGGSVIGYSSRIRFVLDTHDFVATALPETANGIDGYSFHVTHNGSMLITGPSNANGIRDKIHRLARRYGDPIEVAVR